MSLRLGAYLRVSTEEQAEVVEGSLDNQRYRTAEFVRAKNFDGSNWGKIVDFYIDDGYSAKDTKRPAYQRMMADIKKGKINLILVTDLSRLSRNIQDFSNLLAYLDSHKSKFLSMKEQFDTSTPAGKMMIFNMINLAQFEREQTSERVALNCHARSMRGLMNGGKAMLGYDHAPDHPGVLKVNADEAEQVTLIFQKFLELGSRGQTIKFLHSIRLFPKGHSASAIERRWSSNSLGSLLSHAAYIGFKEVNRMNRLKDQSELKPWQKYKLVKASWPGIIDRNIYDRVQVLLAETANFYRQRKAVSGSRIFLLSGMLTCGECGKPLMGQTAHGRVSRHRYYVHNQHSKDHHCSIIRYKADEIEELVAKHFAVNLADAGYFENLSGRIQKSARSGKSYLAGEAKRVRDALVAMDKQISRAYQIQSRGHLTQEALQLVSEDLNRLAMEKKALKDFAEELDSMKIDSEEAEAQGESLRERLLDFEKGWAKAPGAQKKILLKRVIKRLVTMPDGIQIVFRLKDGLEEKRNNGIEPEKVEVAKNVIEAMDRFSEDSRKRKPRDLTSQGSHNQSNGRRTILLNAHTQVSEIARKSQISPLPIKEEITFLYRQNLSLRDIAKQLNLSKTTVREHLIKAGEVLRPKDPTPQEVTQWRITKTKAPPPFGYCYFQGRLVKNPVEYDTLLKIHRQWKAGMGANELTRYLNAKNLKPRKAKAWHNKAVKKILSRFESKKIVIKGDKL